MKVITSESSISKIHVICSKIVEVYSSSSFFDREYVVRRGLRIDFVVVVGDHQELLYENCLESFSVISGREVRLVMELEGKS